MVIKFSETRKSEFEVSLAEDRVSDVIGAKYGSHKFLELYFICSVSFRANQTPETPVYFCPKLFMCLNFITSIDGKRLPGIQFSFILLLCS